MANHEILLAEDDIRLQSALTVTRRMRRAALSVEAEGLSAKATGTKQQSILRDAEQLVIAAAAVAIRSKRDLDTDVIPEADVLNQQRGRMDVLLGRAKKKYEGHTPYVFAGGTRNFKGELEELDRGWQDVLRLSYIGGNKIGLSVAELASSRTGVLAPLSSDYMLAEIHRAYIESKGVSTFSVKPVIVDRFDRTGDRVILPRSRGGVQAFADKRQIALFVDVRGMGLTSRALWQAANKAYVDQTIYGKGREAIPSIIYDRAQQVTSRRRTS